MTRIDIPRLIVTLACFYLLSKYQYFVAFWVPVLAPIDSSGNIAAVAALLSPFAIVAAGIMLIRRIV
jgi:hypothetical protein